MDLSNRLPVRGDEAREKEVGLGLGRGTDSSSDRNGIETNE